MAELDERARAALAPHVPRFELRLVDLREALCEVLDASDGLAALEVLLRYLVATHGRLDVERIGKLLEKAAGPRAQEVVVTVLDEIEERGRARGRAEMLLELLAARFGAVPTDVSAHVMAADQEAIARWAMRVLTAPTLKDVFGENGKRASKTRQAPARKRPRRA